MYFYFNYICIFLYIFVINNGFWKKNVFIALCADFGDNAYHAYYAYMTNNYWKTLYNYVKGVNFF